MVGPRVLEVLLALAALAVAVGAGAAIAIDRWQPLAAALGAGAAAALTLSPYRGVLIGLLVVASINGLPGVDLAAAEEGLRGTDLATLALIGCGLLRLLLDPPQRRPAHLKPVLIWSAALTAWWLVTYLRAVVGEDAPFLEAGFFGRDFLFFALLLPILLLTLRSRDDIVQMLVVVTGATVLYALGHLFVTLAVQPLPLLVHINGVNKIGPFARVYAAMNEAVLLGFPLAIGIVISAWSSLARGVALVLLPVLGASFMLQFTRATYFGLGVAVAVFILAGALFSRSGAEGLRATRWLALLAAVCVGFFVLNPQSEFGDTPLTAVRDRVTAGFQELGGESAGTLDYRAMLGREINAVVGGKWPIGVGFVPPSFRYEPTIPGGGLRNPDVGVLNAVATMGVVGAILIYLPPVLTLLLTMRRLLRGGGRDGSDGLRVGVSLWLIATLSTSLTLITLFSPIGLALTAAVLALALRIDDEGPVDVAPAVATPPAGRTAVAEPAAAPPPRRRRTAPLTWRRRVEPPVPRPSPVLGVVVVTYESASTIAECLGSVREHFPNARIVVVDNDSKDASVATARRAAPDAKIIETGANLGFGRGCNIGVRALDTDFFLLLNPDAVIASADPGAIAEMAARRPVGLVGPLVAHKSGLRPPAHLMFAPTSLRTDFVRQVLGPLVPRRLDWAPNLAGDTSAGWLSGAALFASRNEFLAAGGFDEAFFLYYEDRDLSMRYRKAGLPLRRTNALVCDHVAGGSSVGDPLRVAQYGWAILSWIEFVHKWKGPIEGRFAAGRTLRALMRAENAMRKAGRVMPFGPFKRKQRQFRAIRDFLEAKGREQDPAGFVPEARRALSIVSGPAYDAWHPDTPR